MQYIKRDDIVRPGRTPLRSQLNAGSEAPRSAFQLDMNSRSISVDSNTGVALILLRKKSMLDGTFGYTYILEERIPKDGDDFPGKFGLYGGKLEYDAERDVLSRYERAREAASRELLEETGVEITPNSLQHVISAVLHREGSSRIGVEVFINNDTSESQIDYDGIVAYQQARQAEAKALRDEIARLKAAGGDGTDALIEDKEALLLGLKDKTNVGPPMKVRRMNDNWMMLGRFMNKPVWHEMTPLAAYSLLADPSYEASARR